MLFALLHSPDLANAAAAGGPEPGAKKPDRAERAVWKAGAVGAVFLGTVGLVFIAAAPQIVGIFTDDPVVLGHGIRGLRIISAGFAFYAYGMTFTQSLNGAGETWAPTWLNGLCFWGFELPLAWILAVHAGLETTGAFIRLPRRLFDSGQRAGSARGSGSRSKEPASPVARHCAQPSGRLKPVRRPCACPAHAALRRRRLDCSVMTVLHRRRPVLSRRASRCTASLRFAWTPRCASLHGVPARVALAVGAVRRRPDGRLAASVSARGSRMAR